MGYDYQLVLRMGDDTAVGDSCASLEAKRYDRDDAVMMKMNEDGDLEAVIGEDNRYIYRTEQVDIPDWVTCFRSPTKNLKLTNNSRIYVVGHGDEESSEIGKRNVDEVAAIVTSFIPENVKIARLSLLSCYSGGNPNSMLSFLPEMSFAWSLYARVREP